MFAQDEDRFLAPASNMKMATTAAALHFLGPLFRYKTFIYADGPLEEGILRGDLILYGTGDPGISERFYRNRTDVFEAFAGQIIQAGITRIEGAVIGDATYFSGPDLGPEWDPRDLNEWFAASASSLSFNENIVTLQILPSARLGSPPRIETIPFGFPLDVSNRAETVVGRPRPNLWLDRVEPTARIHIDGEIRQGGPDIWRRLTVPDPVFFAARALREVLISEGIGVRAPERAVHAESHSRITGRESWAPGLLDPDEPWLLGQHTSPELLEYLTVVNHESHNLFTETIIKTIGKVATGDGSFEGGARAVHSFAIREAGIEAEQIIAVDGSGLSKSNRTSAGALVGLLQQVAASDHWTRSSRRCPKRADPSAECTELVRPVTSVQRPEPSTVSRRSPESSRPRMARRYCSVSSRMNSDPPARPSASRIGSALVYLSSGEGLLPRPRADRSLLRSSTSDIVANVLSAVPSLFHLTSRTSKPSSSASSGWKKDGGAP